MKLSGKAPDTERTLRRLFLTLFLRGRSSRGTTAGKAPTSIGVRLAMSLGVHAMLGLLVLPLSGQSTFIISAYLHAATFIFLGMFIATSAGETLFNKEEGDILLHRPIEPRALLWGKISVLVQVSIWLAGAFNLVGLIVGSKARDGSWLFLLVHSFSTALEALFCTAIVVMTYQLCLRWFGREKLDSFMTATQVIVSVAFIIGAQLVPQLMMRLDGATVNRVHGWWMFLLPPAWFAGIDDALVGSGLPASWLLGAMGIGATSAVVWVAFRKLATSYQSGLQAFAESAPQRPARARTSSRLLERLVRKPPLSWWLRDPVARSTFLLSAAYLLRDRDTKMRVYPGVAPMLVFPILMLIPRSADGGGGGRAFGAAFSGSYIGLIPLMVLGFLELSQQWQASDVFRTVPVSGPAPFTNGARRAVIALITLPMLVAFALLVVLLGKVSQLQLMLPGIVALPIYAMIPCMGGRGVPLSKPAEEAKNASRTFLLFGVMAISAGIAGLAVFAHSNGWLWKLLALEVPIVALVYWMMRRKVQRAAWGSIE